MEQQNLYDSIDLKTSAYSSDTTGQLGSSSGEHPSNAADQVNKFASLNGPETFRCPSTVSPHLIIGEHKDYAVNVGREITWWNSPLSNPAVENYGIGRRDESINMGRIYDGTSNTFLMLERKNYNDGVKPDDAHTNPFLFSTHLGNGGVLCGYSKKGGVSNAPLKQKFSIGEHFRTASGDHPGGINASMVDGSVHFVADTISWDPWYAFHTRSGGESESLNN